MTTLQNSLNYLRAQHMRFAHTTHSPAFTAEEVAMAEHMPADRMSKTVLLRNNDGFVMAVVPADTFVDLEKLRMAMGVPDLYLAQESDLAQLFPNSEVGAMPPIGPLFHIPVYLDRKVANREFIAFNAGTHRDVIHMRTADYWQLVRPVVGDFCGEAEIIPATLVHFA